VIHGQIFTAQKASDVGEKIFTAVFIFFRKTTSDNFPENFKYFSINVIVDNNNNNNVFINITSIVLFKLQCFTAQ